MNAFGRVEPSLDSQTVDEWADEVRPAADTSTRTASRTRSRSSTPWLLLIGGASAFAMLMAFQQVVEGSVRDAPLKRARSERVVACGVADATPSGTVCSELSSPATTSSPRRSANPAYAQLAR